MWRAVPKNEEDRFLDVAIDFTGNDELYGSWMMQVVKQWPVACEHNLTDLSINRKAWVGHAAICLAHGCPEYVTRLAWGKLTEQQRIKANAKAQQAIDAWEREQGETCQRLF